MEAFLDVPTGLVLLGSAVAVALWMRHGRRPQPTAPTSDPRTAAATALCAARKRVIDEHNKQRLAGSAAEERRRSITRKLSHIAPLDPRVVARAVADLTQAAVQPVDLVASRDIVLRAGDEFAKLVESRRSTSPSDAEELPQLHTLWNIAFGSGVSFERISERWSTLGFQGLDPQTDLRGGGLLALDHFVAFAQGHEHSFHEMITFNNDQHASKGHSWFLPAVVSIQFTTQLALGEIALLPPHMSFILADNGGVSRGLQRLHALLLLHFFSVWKAKLPHVMEYTQFVGPNVIDTFLVPDWHPPLG